MPKCTSFLSSCIKLAMHSISTSLKSLRRAESIRQPFVVMVPTALTNSSIVCCLQPWSSHHPSLLLRRHGRWCCWCWHLTWIGIDLLRLGSNDCFVRLLSKEEEIDPSWTHVWTFEHPFLAQFALRSQKKLGKLNFLKFLSTTVYCNCGFSPKSTPKYPPGKGQDPPIKRGPRTFAPFFLRHASKKGATCLKKRSNLPQKKGATFNLTNTRILRRWHPHHY